MSMDEDPITTHATRLLYVVMCLPWLFVLPKPTAHPFALIALFGVCVWYAWLCARKLHVETWLVVMAGANFLGAAVQCLTTYF